MKSVEMKLKNKHIGYCFELLFGIISFSSYFNIDSMNIISSDTEMNNVLANNPILLLKQLAEKIC